MNKILVYITFSSEEEAIEMVQELLKKDLIACGNILPQSKSLYKYKGVIEQTSETLVLCKTTENAYFALESFVCANHSYDLPCVMTLPISGGSVEFLNWIANPES